jgi:hypothetical protein
MNNRFLASLLFVCVSVWSIAQGLPSAPHLNVSQKSTFLLMNDQIRANLGLSASEIKAYLAANQYRAKSQQKLMTAKDPLVKEIAILDTTYADKVWKSLTPAHRQRLLGMAVARQIAAKIGLAKSQSAKVAGLLKEKKKKNMAFEEMVSTGLAHSSPADRPAILKSYDAERAKLSAEQKLVDKKVLSLLSAAQLKKWQALAR